MKFHTLLITVGKLSALCMKEGRVTKQFVEHMNDEGLAWLLADRVAPPHPNNPRPKSFAVNGVSGRPGTIGHHARGFVNLVEEMGEVGISTVQELNRILANTEVGPEGKTVAQEFRSRFFFLLASTQRLLHAALDDIAALEEQENLEKKTAERAKGLAMIAAQMGTKPEETKEVTAKPEETTEKPKKRGKPGRKAQLEAERLQPMTKPKVDLPAKTCPACSKEFKPKDVGHVVCRNCHMAQKAEGDARRQNTAFVTLGDILGDALAAKRLDMEDPKAIAQA